MRLSQFLQFPPKFLENENLLFNENESLNLINLYKSMNNSQLTKSQKIDKIKEILRICLVSFGKERKKIICLLMFSVLQTAFGRSIIQEDERFRQVVFDRYELFITENDQDFIDTMFRLRI